MCEVYLSGKNVLFAYVFVNRVLKFDMDPPQVLLAGSLVLRKEVLRAHSNMENHLSKSWCLRTVAGVGLLFSLVGSCRWVKVLAGIFSISVTHSVNINPFTHLYIFLPFFPFFLHT